MLECMQRAGWLTKEVQLLLGRLTGSTVVAISTKGDKIVARLGHKITVEFKVQVTQ